jgi:hypothetical protein
MTTIAERKIQGTRIEVILTETDSNEYMVTVSIPEILDEVLYSTTKHDAVQHYMHPFVYLSRVASETAFPSKVEV